MEVFFRNILEISIMASFLIVAVLLIRLCFKKASATFRCILWMLVGIRLLVPVSISTPFGLVPDVDLSVEQEPLLEGGNQAGALVSGISDEEDDSVFGTDGFGQDMGIGSIQGNIADNKNDASTEPGNLLGSENMQEAGSQHSSGNMQVPGTDVGTGTAYIPNAGSMGSDTESGLLSGVETNDRQGDVYGDAPISGEDAESEVAYIPDADTANQNRLLDEENVGWKIATGIWIAGSCLMLVYMLVSSLRLRKSLREALPSYVTCGEEPVKVYRHESVDSPFLMGVFSPKIYVPMKLAGKDLQYVLAHERMHLRRRDHLLKPLSFIVLALYWFHPLVWVAYILLGRDIELACDERVLRENPRLDRAAYAEALLDCAVKQRKIAVCPVAFGEVDVKQRVTNVLNYKKPGFWIMFVCVLLGVLVVLMFMTVAGEEESLPAGTEDVQESDGTGNDETGSDTQGEDVSGDNGQDDGRGNEDQGNGAPDGGKGTDQPGTGQAAVGEQLPTQERVAKYRMYFDVLTRYNEGGNPWMNWNYVTSEFVYERSRWFEEYNGEQLQRIALDETPQAATCEDIIYYRAEDGEDIHEITLKMLDALLEPLVGPDTGNPCLIKEYAIRNQQVVQIGDGIWLLPYIDGYYDYDGVDLVSMENYRQTEGFLEWNGLMPFMREGSSAAFHYLLIEENGIYRLQYAGAIQRAVRETVKTVEGEPENELIFYYPVNSMNAPDYIPPNEHELIAPDCFWAGNGRVFLDDSINGRILVYQNGLYEKTIALPWEMDLQKMHYVPETDELKVVFYDRSKTGSDYYLVGIDVSSGMLLDAGEWDAEIGNVHEIMAGCCFDGEGVLWRDMHYDKVQEPDVAFREANHIVTLGGAGEFPYTVTEELKASTSYLSDSWDIVAKHNETNYYLRSRYVSGEGGNLSAAVVMKNDTHVATPEPDWNGSPILSLGPAGNIYQMVVDGGGVRIYRLGFAEYDADDRNDMIVRQIQLSDVTLRKEEAVPTASYEGFQLLDIARIEEWTKDGKFAELVQTKGMGLFYEYDNLEPSVLYKGAGGASYSCLMDYDGKTYQLTITYKIDKDSPDVKRIQRIYMEALENGRKVVLYSVDESEVLGDFGDFLISSYGVEKQISFALPEGFVLGAYNKQFSNYKASFLEGNIAAKPGDEFADEWAISPGGIGTFGGDYLAYDESGAATGFAHWWTGTGATWREDACEKVEGCFTSAVITEYHMEYFKTAPDHYDFMQKYPELADQHPEPVDFWYVYICDESMDVGYVVFLNEAYFTKEDAIAFARSVRPIE